MAEAFADSVAGSWADWEGLIAVTPTCFCPGNEKALAGVPPAKTAPEDEGTIGLGLAKEKALAGMFPDEAALETKGTFCLGLEKANALGALAAGVPDETVPGGCLELPKENAPTDIPGRAGPKAPGMVCFPLANEKEPMERFAEVPSEIGPGCNGLFSVETATESERA